MHYHAAGKLMPMKKFFRDGNYKGFINELSVMLRDINFAMRTPELFYHAILYTIAYDCCDKVENTIISGGGIPDIIATIKNHVFIFEVKSLGKTESIDEKKLNLTDQARILKMLSDSADRAIKQIIDKKYYTQPQSNPNCTKITLIGITFLSNNIGAACCQYVKVNEKWTESPSVEKYQCIAPLLTTPNNAAPTGIITSDTLLSANDERSHKRPKPSSSTESSSRPKNLRQP